MTEEYHCYENALAERVNGHLKRWILSRSDLYKRSSRQKSDQKRN